MSGDWMRFNRLPDKSPTTTDSGRMASRIVGRHWPRSTHTFKRSSSGRITTASSQSLARAETQSARAKRDDEDAASASEEAKRCGSVQHESPNRMGCPSNPTEFDEDDDEDEDEDDDDDDADAGASDAGINADEGRGRIAVQPRADGCRAVGGRMK